jgi:hypothetical protein
LKKVAAWCASRRVRFHRFRYSPCGIFPFRAGDVGSIVVVSSPSELGEAVGMTRTALFLLVVAATLAVEPDPRSSKEFLNRELLESDKRVVKVSVGQHTPTGTGALIEDAEVTRKEQYLVWGTEGHSRRLQEWKMDAAKQWLVSTEGNGLMAYDLVRGFMVPIETRLPVEALLEISDRETAEVTVR